ncbi:hypothetical protein [Streptomyces lavenduligriseus]|uniref:Uncharacterized protein n=1 Tax=Streptomyces lavenduligriseus TaxID=67315 RepID=A0ABT0P5U6_9ACTN|nr:hypothetical protein [Streptomyces lavenduligriseus]MCL3998756.1 hypothetical protein [Streptomyces lavenduligriseus]
MTSTELAPTTPVRHRCAGPDVLTATGRADLRSAGRKLDESVPRNSRDSILENIASAWWA